MLANDKPYDPMHNHYYHNVAPPVMLVGLSTPVTIVISIINHSEIGVCSPTERYRTGDHFVLKPW